MKISRVFNTRDTFTPPPWRVFKVDVLRDIDGEAIGFYEHVDAPEFNNDFGSWLFDNLNEENRSMISQLPCEMFNHELKELDLEDAEALASFMTEYGMIFQIDSGFLAWQAYLRVEKTLVETFDALVVACDEALPESGEWSSLLLRQQVIVDYMSDRYGPNIEEQFIEAKINELKVDLKGIGDDEGRFEETFGMSMRECKKKIRALKRGIIPDDMKEEISHIENIINLEPLGRKIAYPVSRDVELYPFLVSIEEVQSQIMSFLGCARIAKALMEDHDLKRIAELLDLPSEEEAFFIIRHHDEFISDHLKTVSPSMGIVCESPQGLTHEIYLPGSSDGSLCCALALQIRKFNLMGEDHYNICDECGEIFIERRAKGRKNKPHEDASFCCDRCKNRHTQRVYRNSPGYKNKQQKKKANPAH